MTKSELKSIIKECLLEILTDGLGESINEVSQKKKEAQALLERRENEKRILQRKRELKSSISYATQDPVLKSILEHTAQTTLKDQSVHEHRVPSMAASYSDDDVSGPVDSGPGINIDNLFGAASKNWSAAAFGEKKRPG